MPDELSHFIGLLDRKLGGNAILEWTHGRQGGDSENMVDTVLVFRQGDYCGEVRLNPSSLAVPPRLLIHNENVERKRQAPFQEAHEVYTTKFGRDMDNSAALKLAVSTLVPLPMRVVFERILKKIDVQYTTILRELRIDMQVNTGKLLSASVVKAAATAGIQGVDVVQSTSHYISSREVYILLGALVEKVVVGDKDGVFNMVESIFSHDISGADDYLYKYEKLVEFELSKAVAIQQLYVELLRDDSVRVIHLQDIREYTAAQYNNYYTLWHPAAKRYAATYSNPPALPQSIFEGVATLKAAGEKRYIPGVGIMMSSNSWCLEGVTASPYCYEEHRNYTVTNKK